MALRLITGRSGQGKTEYIMREVIRRSVEEPDKNYYVIVPEQFSLEMQQKIVERHPRHGFFNIDVLSFHRLAYRIFSACDYRPDTILEDLGIAMVLRRLLSERESEFLYFKKSLKKAGFIDELKSMLIELVGYGISGEDLRQAAGKLPEHSILKMKCEELAKVYETFSAEISGRFIVTEQLLDLAGGLTAQADLLQDAVFYFDGFLGFTPVQFSFLRKLLSVAHTVNITVTIPEPLGAFGATEELFTPGVEMIRTLERICEEESFEMAEPVCLCADTAPRFSGNRELAFLEAHSFRGERACYEEALQNIHLTVCQNAEEEADYITHKIEQLVRQKGYKYRDFAILCGNVEEYAPAFERKAALLNLPLFEDTKKSASYHSGVEAIRALFHLAEMDYSYESVFRYLKSGMSDFSDTEADRLENYVLAAGIRGYGMYKKPFTRQLQGREPEEIAALESLRERLLSETGAFYAAIRDKEKNVREKMTALYETFRRLRFEEKLEEMAAQAEAEGDYVKATEHGKLYELLLALLDKIVLIFDEEALSVRELAEIFDAGLSQLGLGTAPLAMDQVLLGDLKRTRLHDIKILFIAGMNEGKIPFALEDRGLLSDDEKSVLRELGITLSDGLLAQSVKDEFYMYMAFSRPSEALYFSYALVGGDAKTLRPSPLLGSCQRMFPKLISKAYPTEERKFYFNEADSQEFLIRHLARLWEEPESAERNRAFRMLLAYWNEDAARSQKLAAYVERLEKVYGKEDLSPALALALYGSELAGSVTRLERFVACPYQYYCIYGLELRERDTYAVRPVDLGNIFHRALELFSGKVRESAYTWKSLPAEEQELYIGESLREAVDENLREVFKSSARNQYKIHTIERILKRTIEILRIQLKDSAFEPERFELHFGKDKELAATDIPLSEGRRMALKGSVDRVDVCREDDEILLRVIDYKSGAKKFALEDLYYGLQLQLIVYMNVADEIYEKEEGRAVTPAGVFYYHMKDPILNTTQDKYLTDFRMSGYANGDGDILAKLEDGSDGFLSMPVRLKKNGEPYANSPVMGTESFLAMGRHARRKAAEIGERIYAGELQARPYRNKKGTACETCPFAAVCGFDPRLAGYEYQKFSSLSKEEILKRMQEEE